MRPTTLRDVVRAMTAAGHIRRRDNPADRRSHFLETTAAGKRFLRRADDVVREVERELEAELGGGVDELRPPLRRLRRAAQSVWAVER